jgi:hypothetical protein
MRLYVAQLLFLSYGGSVDPDLYGEAYWAADAKKGAAEPAKIP